MAVYQSCCIFLILLRPTCSREIPSGKSACMFASVLSWCCTSNSFGSPVASQASRSFVLMVLLVSFVLSISSSIMKASKDRPCALKWANRRGKWCASTCWALRKELVHNSCGLFTKNRKLYFCQGRLKPCVLQLWAKAKGAGRNLNSKELQCPVIILHIWFLRRRPPGHAFCKNVHCIF